MDSKVAADTTCHFLRVPLEIRHGIYRYLLLETSEASLDPSYDEKVFNEMMDQEKEERATADVGDAYEHSHNQPNPDGEGEVMHNHLNSDQHSPSWCDYPYTPPAIAKRSPREVAAEEKRIAECKRKFDEEYKVHRYPAILQTNRQIFKEASTFMYSSLVMEVRPSDVICSDVWKGIVASSDNIWRSCPLHIGVKNSIEGLKCKGSILGGTMDPHVFAKFEKIFFSADLNFDPEGERLWPTVFVDDKLHTSQEDEDSFTACLNGEGSNRPPVSDIFQQFVNVLVKSPYISHLDVSLGVEINAEFAIDSGDDFDAEEEEENPERAKLIDEDEERKLNMANKRVIELVLEAGVLNPLKQLENVKCLSLSFDVLPCNDVEFEPRPRHLKIIKDLKETVEDNFVVKHGAV